MTNQQPHVVNLSAIGNPHEEPTVWIPDNLVALLAPCQTPVESKGQTPCGGVNRYHAYDCPHATEGKTFVPRKD